MLKKNYRSFPEATNVHIADSAFVGWNSRLGVPDEPNMLKWPKEAATYKNRKVSIGDNVLIGCNVVIYEGVTIDANVIVEDGVIIGPDSSIGARSRICYAATVCDEVAIGRNCVIGGFVCDGAMVEDGARIFGSLVHEHSQPHKDWWAIKEKAPRIRKHTVVGWGATVIGDVTVGPYCYVLPGAVVRTSVPPKSVYTRDGKIIPAEAWRGSKLKKLIAWWGRARVND